MSIAPSNPPPRRCRKWAETPVVDRARVMFQYRELIGKHFDELAALVTREHGKTAAEARASVQRGIEMVEFACGIPSLIMGQCLENIATNVDSETSRHPVGVCVGITPFNFPAMVPLWMFPGGHHLRQHVCVEAVGKSAALGGAARRIADGSRACLRACSTSCTATRNASMPCSRIRWCGRFRSSAARMSPSTFTKPARATASACRPPAGRRTI